jgi:glutamate dehydrogenase (NAD(P)+)
VDKLFHYGDELGPLKIIRVREPSLKLEAVLVIDNLARGPSLGGIRMAPDVTFEECARLARAMTLKNAAADLPHGGGKMVIRADPTMPEAKKKDLLQALAQALSNEIDYIFAPDMGMDEQCMAWMHDVVDRVAGLPRELGGIPLDEIGATAWGLLHATQAACRLIDLPIQGAKLVVQGFGAVGMHAVRYFSKHGAVIVGVADLGGAIYNPDGLPVQALEELKSSGRSVADFQSAERISAEKLLSIPCDIWIPAARPDVIREDNVDLLDTRLIVQGANIPVTANAEKRLHERGILNLPDFIANAGGVICAAMEYQGVSEAIVLDTIADKVRRNTENMLDSATRKGILPRQAANEMALDRVHRAMRLRRWSSFSSSPSFR